MGLYDEAIDSTVTSLQEGNSAILTGVTPKSTPAEHAIAGILTTIGLEWMIAPLDWVTEEGCHRLLASPEWKTSQVVIVPMYGSGTGKEFTIFKKIASQAESKTDSRMIALVMYRSAYDKRIVDWLPSWKNYDASKG